MPPGSYDVHAGWYSALTKKPVGPQDVVIGHFNVDPAGGQDPGKLQMQHSADYAFAQGLRLIGYENPPDEVDSGQKLPLRLFWKADSRPPADYDLAVTVAGNTSTVPLPHTSAWLAGEIVETRMQVPIRSAWSGKGPVVVALSGTPGQFELPVQVAINPIARVTAKPVDAPPEGAVLGDKVYLAASQVQQEQVEGRPSLTATLDWVPMAVLNRDYVSYVHVLDPSGKTVAQSDSIPAEGKRPTSGWDLGETVVDVHKMSLDGLHGVFSVEVGLYEPSTGSRLGSVTLQDQVSVP
jgi:hypothetical protein